MTLPVQGELGAVRTGDWLDAQVFPPLAWAVPGLVPEGFGLLVGPPKAGKSWAALAIGLAVAGGREAFGKIPVGPARPVLYLALEDGDRRLQERCRSVLGGEKIPALLNYATTADSRTALPLIEDWLDLCGCERPLVLVDTLGKIAPPPAAGDSAYARDYRIGSRIKAMSDSHAGVAVLVIHHDRKAGSEDFVDAVSGTHGLAGSADFVLVLDRKRQESGAVLKVTGRDVMEAEYAMNLSDSGSWTLTGDSLAESARQASTARARAGLGDRSAEIVNRVSRSAQGIRLQEVAETFHMSSTAAGTYLGRLVDAGRIVRIGRGVYGPVETVESVES